MEQEPFQSAEDWAVGTDLRRRIGRPATDRSVAAAVARALVASPSASLPQALGTWGETQGAYRFLSDPAFNYEDLLQLHWNQVYGEAADRSRTLLLGFHDRV